jgi:hypothetical protein
MRVSERKSLIEVKKRWETRSSPSCNRASCRTCYNIDYVMVDTLHQCYTTAVHVNRRCLSGILLNHPTPVEDVRIHGLGRPLAGTGDPGRLSRDGAAKHSLFFTREPDSDPGPLVFYSPTSHSHLDLASVSPSPCA